jgi:uncharacterized membrane protein
LRVVVEPLTFAALADLAFTPLRHYAGGSFVVTLRLLEAIAALAGCTRTTEQRHVLLRHAEMIREQGQTHIAEPADRTALDERYALARVALVRPPG